MALTGLRLKTVFEEEEVPQNGMCRKQPIGSFEISDVYGQGPMCNGLPAGAHMGP
jgi:hypothetical protein